MNSAFVARFRFHGNLQDHRRDEPVGDVVEYSFGGTPSVKDAIEAQGVPHPEVDVILVNGTPVGFDHHLQDGEVVDVHPVASEVDVPPDARLQRLPSGERRFVLDVNLGKLARWLRLLGFDARYRNDFSDAEVARISAEEDRIALTRDRALLHQKIIRHGYWVRADEPSRQVREVAARYGLASRVQPFHRCLECNGLIAVVEKEEVLHLLEPRTKRYYETFFRCSGCGKVYWKGSHYAGILAKLQRVLGERGEG